MAKDAGFKPTDQQLWQKVAETVTPLKDRPAGPALPARRRFEKPVTEQPLPKEWMEGAPLSQPSDGLALLDKKDRRRLSQGRLVFDHVLDLHGMTQDQAYNRLIQQIHNAIRHGNRILLVITGKGGKKFAQTGRASAASRTRADFDQHGGVLKRMVPLWLAGPELSAFIHSVGPAAQEHGGDGALYVRLRRRPSGFGSGGFGSSKIRSGGFGSNEG